MSSTRRRPERRAHKGNRSGSDARMDTGTSEPEYLIIGRVLRPHGVRGGLLVTVLTDYPERIASLDTVYVGENDYKPFDVAQVGQHNKGVILFLEGFDNRDDVEVFREKYVYVKLADAVPLEEGEYYIFQLVGIRVVTDEGLELGHLVDLLETGANDVYVINDEDGKEILLPVIPDVIKNIDLQEKVMTVHLLDGLIE